MIKFKVGDRVKCRIYKEYGIVIGADDTGYDVVWNTGYGESRCVGVNGHFYTNETSIGPDKFIQEHLPATKTLIIIKRNK